ncbi:hypothetical protein CCUS01_00485 [Colletotrichum cuscutae]|uniref:Uncharacterized protein n=1 Tax=Colletotrichum cuscutae TaxID=1209917 RepID=A0AAI9Y460_9PEZI|nr:hypothetical protein CCUS01_00485 [Colletotrichum cuscutae]
MMTECRRPFHNEAPIESAAARHPVTARIRHLTSKLPRSHTWSAWNNRLIDGLALTSQTLYARQRRMFSPFVCSRDIAGLSCLPRMSVPLYLCISRRFQFLFSATLYGGNTSWPSPMKFVGTQTLSACHTHQFARQPSAVDRFGTTSSMLERILTN